MDAGTPGGQPVHSMRSLPCVVFASFAACQHAAVSEAPAPLEIPAIFADHMVLQQHTQAPLWGRTTPGTRVQLVASWDGEPQYCTARKDGTFRIDLATPEAGGPFTITVEAGLSRRVLQDVLIGEVWLGSGQSNMEMSVGDTAPGYRGVVNWQQEVAAANHPQIRLFTVENKAAASAQTDLRGTWQVCTPDSAHRFSATAFFFGKRLHHELRVPIGLIAADWGGTPAESWTSPQALQAHGGFTTQLAALTDPATAAKVNAHTPGALYQGMIAPLVPYALAGWLWYQGESNRTRAAQYETLFPALIRDWRAHWGKELPFFFVQIAPYAYANDRGEAAALRAAQAKARSLPATGMAVTMDIGNPKDIHPANKQEVGHRLVRLALAKVYGRSEVVCEGPEIQQAEFGTQAITLRFHGAHGGLAAADRQPLRGFEVAGPDRVFVAAEATLTDAADTVVVKVPPGQTAQHLRYGWAAAIEPNLANGAGLPCVPFQRDR